MFYGSEYTDSFVPRAKISPTVVLNSKTVLDGCYKGYALCISDENHLWLPSEILALIAMQFYDTRAIIPPCLMKIITCITPLALGQYNDYNQG